MLTVGIEDIEPGHWVAWVLPVPGCYGSGTTEEEALAGVPDAWRAETGRDAPGPLRVVERWRGVPAADDPGFIVNATFADDRRPLETGEIEAGITRIIENHRQFQKLLTRCDLTGEIGGIVRHLATAEQWYLGNIDLVRDGERPDDPMERFTWIRAFSLRALPKLAGCDILTDSGGEGWTPRKLVGRTIWHERDHTQQIARILRMSA